MLSLSLSLLLLPSSFVLACFLWRLSLYFACFSAPFSSHTPRQIVSYYEWWSNTRDIDNDGLVVILHGWESGLDASPLYDGAYNVHEPKPALSELYPKFMELVIEYKFKYVSVCLLFVYFLRFVFLLW